MKKFTLLIFLFILSCDKSKLGNNYFYLSNDEAADIGYPYGSLIYESSKQYFYQKKLISAEIVKVLSDDQHIIVMQHPNINSIKRQIIDDLNFWEEDFKRYRKDSIINFEFGNLRKSHIKNLLNDKQKIDSLLSNSFYYKKIFSNKTNYYLIKKEKHVMLGPFSENEFKKVILENKVSLTF